MSWQHHSKFVVNLCILLHPLLSPAPTSKFILGLPEFQTSRPATGDPYSMPRNFRPSHLTNLFPRHSPPGTQIAQESLRGPCHPSCGPICTTEWEHNFFISKIWRWQRWTQVSKPDECIYQPNKNTGSQWRRRLQRKTQALSARLIQAQWPHLQEPDGGGRVAFRLLLWRDYYGPGTTETTTNLAKGWAIFESIRVG